MYLITGRGRRKSSAGASRIPPQPQPQSLQHSHKEDSLNLPQHHHQQQQKQSRNTTQHGGSEPAGYLGISHSGFDDDGDEDAGFDEADLNDPGLLGELEAMRREMMGLRHHNNSVEEVPPRTGAGMSSSQHRQINSDRPKTNAAVASSAQGSGDDGMLGVGYHSVNINHEEDDKAVEDVTVTDADMNDPLLLAELAKYSTNTSLEKEPVKSLSAQKRTRTGLETETSNEQQHRESRAPAPTTEQQGGAGRTQEVTRQAKSDQRKSTTDQALPRKHDNIALEASAPSYKPSSDQLLPGAFPRTSAVRGQQHNKTSTQSQSTGTVRSLNTPSTAVTSTSGKPTQRKSPPTARPATQRQKGTRIEPNTLKDIEVMNSEFGGVATSFEAMKQKLESQVTQATRLATYYLKTGEKTLAVDFHQLKKRSAADLAAVISLEANGKRLPPAFLHREVQWTVPVEQRRDISISELQVVVKRVFSDGDLAATLGGKNDLYVQWEIGWPRDKNSNSSKGYTRTIKYKEFEQKAGDVDIDYTHNVAGFVDRHYVRPLQRWIERGKVTIELHKYTGMLWGTQVVGRASVPLLDLRTRSEVSSVVEFKPVSEGAGRMGRPFIGGPVFVDVAARLRLPLTNKAELVTHIERWIYLDNKSASIGSGSGQALTEAVSETQSEAKVAAVSTPAEPPAVAEQALQKENSEHSAVKAEERPAKGGSDLPQQTGNDQSKEQEETALSGDKIAELMDSMESIVSNAVLEMELQQIPERLKAAGTGDTEQTGLLREMETAIKLRMSVVAAQVGAGTLTIQDYMESVKREVQQATQWALAAKKGGHRDLALRALRRVKAMRKELEEMQEAMGAE
ncbi:hypothetical protein IWW48_000778 [Coemansia sp. RSA 1200]|nr:hypothetical protein IWW48_000778 [Coemansia sp. RSA 1200]